jgi:phosphotransferase system HPr (HPr) family protein
MELVRRLRISNELGLHARAAAKIVALAGQYEAKLFLKKDENEVDGSSILSVLTLACPRGTELQARAVGEDSEALLQALSTLFEQRFGEGK